MGTIDRDLSSGWHLQYDAVMPRFTEEGAVDIVHNAATLRDPSGKFAFTFGYGEGAMELASGGEFALMHNFDRFSGGVNPVLGFASGETFGAASYKFNGRTQVTVGMTENRRSLSEIPGLSSAERAQWQGIEAQSGAAWTVDVDHQLTDAIALNAQWTRLREDRSLLGTQGTISGFLDNGSTTEAMTFSATVNVGSGISFDLSGTAAKTEEQDGQIFFSSQDVMSSAGQFAVNKRGVLSKNDVMRVSVSQPLNVESGSIEFASDAIIDRTTGERGLITQTIGLETKRRIAGEVLYGTQLGQRAQLSVFGNYLTEGNPGEESAFVVGTNIGWRF